MRLAGPIQLFLACNVVYFVVQPHSSYTGYNTTLSSHMDGQLYSGVVDIRGRVTDDVRSRVDVRVARELTERRARGESPAASDSVRIRGTAEAVESEVYPARFNARGEVFARALVGLIIPMLAAALALLYVGRGVPLVQHVVFATHIHAWTLLFVGSMVLLVWSPFLSMVASGVGWVMGMTRGELLAHPGWGIAFELASELGSAAFVLVYSYLAMNRAYGGHRLATAARAVALTLAGVLGTIVFRFILFWPTWWSM